jgi:hypothetical protein
MIGRGFFVEDFSLGFNALTVDADRPSDLPSRSFG